MVICKICNKQYIRIDNAHLSKKHNMTVEQYLDMFPNSEICSLELRRRLSKASSEQFAKYTAEDWKRRTYKRTPENTRNAAAAMKKARAENWDKIYGKDSERNKKISNAKIEYWKDNEPAKQELSRRAKIMMKKRREEMGEIAFMDMMQANAKKGFATVRGNHVDSKFELKMLNLLETEKYNYVSQYRINRSYFDAFLPDYNILIEFDGDFFHPLSLKECKYPFQVNNYSRDKRKNVLAKESGFKLIRIRESDNVTSYKEIILDKYKVINIKK